MKPSQNFFDLVEAFEGCRLTAYQDIAGIWTIGYGTIKYPDGTCVKEGDTCTQEQAQEWLNGHILGIQLPANFMQQQFDSCLDFCYNAGVGAWNNSSLKQSIIAMATPDTITANFCKWDKAHINGTLIEVPGLLRRRKCEAYLYINGVNHPTFFE